MVVEVYWTWMSNFSLCDLALINRAGDLYGRLYMRSRNGPGSYQIWEEAPVSSTVATAIIT